MELPRTAALDVLLGFEPEEVWEPLEGEPVAEAEPEVLAVLEPLPLVAPAEVGAAPDEEVSDAPLGAAPEAAAFRQLPKALARSKTWRRCVIPGVGARLDGEDISERKGSGAVPQLSSTEIDVSRRSLVSRGSRRTCQYQRRC
jgi:hypothetical protein